MDLAFAVRSLIGLDFKTIGFSSHHLYVVHSIPPIQTKRDMVIQARCADVE